MASTGPSPLPPVVLISGEDEFAVKQRARQIYQNWCAELGGLDHEIIDASVAHSGEALTALGKLREALQTLPFFGTGKAVWFQNCNFLGDERTAGAQAVTGTLAELSQELRTLPWGSLRLLVTSAKIDKRKSFYKTIEKIGAVETYAGWSLEDRNWANEAERVARHQIQSLKKRISSDALARLVGYVGPSARQLHNEIEKVVLFVGERSEIGVEDIDAVVTRNKQSRAFALGDALGDRNLSRVLRTLDEELWEMKTDKQKSEIGLLYGLISKVRVMIFLKEMLREGWIKTDGDFNRFKSQLEHVPAGSLPEDRRFNPLAMNPYVLFKALSQAGRYTLAELIRAMDVLLECNQRLISSGLDEALILQQALVKIVSEPNADRLP